MAEQKTKKVCTRPGYSHPSGCTRSDFSGDDDGDIPSESFARGVSRPDIVWPASAAAIVEEKKDADVISWHAPLSSGPQPEAPNQLLNGRPDDVFCGERPPERFMRYRWNEDYELGFNSWRKQYLNRDNSIRDIYDMELYRAGLNEYLFRKIYLCTQDESVESIKMPFIQRLTFPSEVYSEKPEKCCLDMEIVNTRMSCCSALPLYFFDTKHIRDVRELALDLHYDQDCVFARVDTMREIFQQLFDHKDLLEEVFSFLTRREAAFAVSPLVACRCDVHYPYLDKSIFASKVIESTKSNTRPVQVVYTRPLVRMAFFMNKLHNQNMRHIENVIFINQISALVRSDWERAFHRLAMTTRTDLYMHHVHPSLNGLFGDGLLYHLPSGSKPADDYSLYALHCVRHCQYFRDWCLIFALRSRKSARLAAEMYFDRHFKRFAPHYLPGFRVSLLIDHIADRIYPCVHTSTFDMYGGHAIQMRMGSPLPDVIVPSRCVECPGYPAFWNHLERWVAEVVLSPEAIKNKNRPKKPIRARIDTTARRIAEVEEAVNVASIVDLTSEDDTVLAQDPAYELTKGFLEELEASLDQVFDETRPDSPSYSPPSPLRTPKEEKAIPTDDPVSRVERRVRKRTKKRLV